MACTTVPVAVAQHPRSVSSPTRANDTGDDVVGALVVGDTVGIVVGELVVGDAVGEVVTMQFTGVISV